MELKRLLLSVISWSLTTLAAVGTSVSLLGAESESKDAPFTAVELAKKTEAFWNGVKSIDMTFVKEAPLIIDDGNFVIETRKFRWMFDRASKKQRRLIDEPETEFGVFHSDDYFDGTASYHLSGRDVVSPFKSELEYHMKVAREGIMRYANYEENVNRAVCLDNLSYQFWFPEGHNSHFSYNFKTDSKLSFSEAIARYPSSVPQRSVDESGDVLWTFRSWPTQENADRFPPGSDVTQEDEDAFRKNEIANIAFRDVTVNESKNFLLQSVKTVSFNPQPSGEILIGRVEYVTSSFIQAGGFYFPGHTEIHGTMGDGPAPWIKHTVEKIKIGGKLDFDSFKIPEYTNGSWTGADGIRKMVVWGKDNKPQQIMTTDEYDARMYPIYEELERIWEGEKELGKEKRFGVRLTLCALGTALVLLGIWLKRRKKTRLVGE